MVGVPQKRGWRIKGGIGTTEGVFWLEYSTTEGAWSTSGRGFEEPKKWIGVPQKRIGVHRKGVRVLPVDINSHTSNSNELDGTAVGVEYIVDGYLAV